MWELSRTGESGGGVGLQKLAYDSGLIATVYGCSAEGQECWHELLLPHVMKGASKTGRS